MVTYKGTDKDMKCHGGFQYELEKTYTDDGAIRCGNKGFHSCEVPMDVLTYFRPSEWRRFFSCEADGRIDRCDEDSKIASSELTLKAEIGLVGLIKAQIEYVKKIAKQNFAQGDSGHAAAQGDRGHAAAQGDSGHAAAQGYSGHAAAQGYSGHAAAQGNWGHAAAQGNWGHAAAQGDRGHAAAQGYGGHAAAQGYSGHAEVHGENSIAASFGIDGTAMAEKVGSWLTVYEWEEIDGEWEIKDGKCVRVDGEKIKPNVWYKLENGEFVEVEE